MSKIFVDTNIFVYTIDRDLPAKQRRAQEAIASARGKDQLVVSTQVMQELYAVITRKKGLNLVLAKETVRRLEHMEVVTVTPELIWEAIDCSVLSGISFWDALIVVSAESARCERIWTEDLQEGQVIRGVRVENPFV